MSIRSQVNNRLSSASMVSSLVFIFSIGLVLCSATQFRIPGVPVGVGELALLSFCAVIIPKYFWPLKLSALGHLEIKIILFWLVFYVLLFLGNLLNSPEAVGLKLFVARDFLAFLFCGIVSISSILFFRLNGELKLSIHLFFIFYCLILVVIGVAALCSVGSELFWFSTVRLTGLSLNPNQFALYFSPVLFILLYLLQQYQGSVSNFWVVILTSVFVIIFLLAMLNQSSALFLSWSVSLALYMLIFLFDSKTWYRRCRGIGIIFLSGSIAVVVHPLLHNFLFVEILPADTLKQLSASNPASLFSPSPFEVRMSLFKNGIIGLKEAPVFGFGPGAHSGISAPFEGSEAHNSILDWALMSGLTGVGLLLILAIYLVVPLIKRGEIELLLVLCCIGIFSQAHFVLRHPVVWVYFLLIYLLSRAESSRSEQ